MPSLPGALRRGDPEGKRDAFPGKIAKFTGTRHRLNYFDPRRFLCPRRAAFDRSGAPPARSWRSQPLGQRCIDSLPYGRDLAVFDGPEVHHLGLGCFPSFRVSDVRAPMESDVIAFDEHREYLEIRELEVFYE
jgi:hypothetical protein